MKALRLVPAAAAPALLLAGWASGAPLSAFLDHPARPALLVALLLGRVAMSDTYRFGIQARAEARAQVLLPLLALGTTGAALLLLPALDARGALPAGLRVPHDGLRWAGVAGFALGTGLQAWAARTLGRWFSPRIAIQPGHELVRDGPYAAVRHPFYTGLLLSIAGLPAAFGTWIGLPLAALAAPVVAWRVSVEERLLEAEFGDAFRAHAARTRRLIPFLY